MTEQCKKEIKDKVKELSDKISEYQKELDDIRKQCKHEKYKLSLQSFNEEDPNPKDLRQVCEICNRVLGYPTREEFDKWMLEE